MPARSDDDLLGVAGIAAMQRKVIGNRLTQRGIARRIAIAHIAAIGLTGLPVHIFLPERKGKLVIGGRGRQKRAGLARNVVNLGGAEPRAKPGNPWRGDAGQTAVWLAWEPLRHMLRNRCR